MRSRRLKLTMLTSRKLVAGCLAAACLVGCGGGDRPVYRAGGQVTFADGTPVSAGRVNFRPVDDPKPVVARGEIQPDGTFRLTTFKTGDGALPGRHRVIVMPKITFDVERHTEVIAVDIDPRFESYETSGLEFTVTEKAADNEFLITVEPPGG